jgi:hypothetical protein
MEINGITDISEGENMESREKATERIRNLLIYKGDLI